MKNDLFEKAKQAVAERYQYEDWVTAVSGRKPSGVAMERLIRELFEYGCNEAVEVDREYLERNTHKVMRYAPIEVNTVGGNGILFSWPPLPFPQQPDER